MRLKDAHRNLTEKLTLIYAVEEAENISLLVSENITGIHLRKSSPENKILNSEEIARFHAMEARLLQHEPVQYILNEAWFYDSLFYVDKNVLIPRPETEELTKWIIKENRKKETITIIDIGTGSGCIPIILKRKLPQARVLSCDISEEALKVAQKNATTHKTKIDFLLLDILNNKNWELLPKADIIVSNPPYIPLDEKDSLQKNVTDFEPAIALFVPANHSLIFYEAIMLLGKEKLNTGGCLYLEMHENLSNDVAQLFRKNQYTVELKKDMQGKNRMMKAML